MGACPDPTSPQALAHQLRVARRIKGWSYYRLTAEANVPQRTTERACLTGKVTAHTALKLAHALGLILFTRQEIHRG